MLQTNTVYDTCCSCDATPSGCLPLTIVPLVNPACFGFQPPNGWAPMDWGTKQFTVARRDHKEEDVDHKVLREWVE
jgi:hypothetical protein